jgi:hypothetical protein
MNSAKWSPGLSAILTKIQQNLAVTTGGNIWFYDTVPKICRIGAKSRRLDRQRLFRNLLSQCFEFRVETGLPAYL